LPSKNLVLRERFACESVTRVERCALMGWAVLTPGAEAGTSPCRSLRLVSRSAGVSRKPLPEPPIPPRCRHGILITGSLAVRRGVPVAARHRACGTSMATPLSNVPPEETGTAKQHPRHDTRLSRATHWDETLEHPMVDAKPGSARSRFLESSTRKEVGTC
jgi:hypothetical protein